MEIALADNFKLDVQAHLIDRGLSILGMRGSGKSYTCGVICEQLLEAGQPIIILDLTGEYYTLRERYPILIASIRDQPYADIKGLTEESASLLVEYVFRHGLSLIIDFKRANMLETYRFLGPFLEALYHAAEDEMRPYVLVMDEGHLLLPEKGLIRLEDVRDAQKKVERWVYEIVARGRHYGLGFIIIARRPAEISKMVLNQTELIILHKLFHVADLKYASKYLPKETLQKLKFLDKGEAFVVGLGEPLFIKVRKRLCTHGGGTPLLKPIETPDLTEAVKQLSEIIAQPPSPPSIPQEALEELDRLRKDRIDLQSRIRSLEAELSEANAKIKSLEALANERLKRINELEERLPQVDSLLEKLHRYEERIEKLEAERADLKRQIEELSEIEGRLLKLRIALEDWWDIALEIASLLGMELIPPDIEALKEERDKYRKRCEELEAQMERRRKLAEDVLSDKAVQDWIKYAKNLLRSYLDRRSRVGVILKKVVVTDPNYLFTPDEFPEANLAPTTVAAYLNELTSQGLVLKHERAKRGRTAYSNALPLWVSQNIRRIRIDAPDEALDRIVEQLKSYVLERRFS